MARVAVDVVIKPEILDPQGKAILAALHRSGHSSVTGVRAGKHFELEVDDSVTDAELAALAESVLANPVIESWTVTRIADDSAAAGAAADAGAAAAADADAAAGASR